MHATLSAKISGIACEGPCPALMHVTPLQSYRLTTRHAHFPDGLQTGAIGRGLGEVKATAARDCGLDSGWEGASDDGNLPAWSVV
jgi:hypothetical protein